MRENHIKYLFVKLLEEAMYEEPLNPNDVTSDDKLWALLAYVLSPLIPIILLLMQDKKARPFIKYHTMQALVLGIIEVILYIVIGWTLIGMCVPLILWIVTPKRKLAPPSGMTMITRSVPFMVWTIPVAPRRASKATGKSRSVARRHSLNSP